MKPSPYATLKNNRLTASKNITEPVTVAVTATSQDGTMISKTCLVTIYPAVSAVSIMRDGQKVNGETLPFEDGMTFTIQNEPADSQSGWKVKCSNSAVQAAVTGNVVTLTKVSGKTIAQNAKITITITSTDGSAKSAKVIVQG